ncbi:MAG: ATP synthase F1 subunit gamma [Oscillospiraceae bacterium]|jgi:F-type H+-transporting ATPase subunit gamma|nr:ATP synthase F1 subunit gamma [Oscillospiraceae bacterium]
MQKTNEIRRRIGAVEETRKITNAMHLVASARAKKVIPKMEYNRRFLDQVQAVIKDILLSPHLGDHPYLIKHPHARRTYLVVSGDKGMAGSYNSAVFQLAYREIREKLSARGGGNRQNLSLITIGMTGDEFFRGHGIVPDEQLGGVTQDPSLHNARQIALDVLDRFDQKQTDQVFMIYTPYKNGMAGEPICHRILPLRLSDFLDVNETEPPHAIHYPYSEAEVFQYLVPQYLVSYIFGALMHSYASEHTARMLAMQSATRNADEMLNKLRMEYNLARQAAVTQEIAEITSAVFI